MKYSLEVVEMYAILFHTSLYLQHAIQYKTDRNVLIEWTLLTH